MQDISALLVRFFQDPFRAAGVTLIRQSVSKLGRLFGLELMPAADDGAKFDAHLPPAGEVVHNDWSSGLYFEIGLVGELHGTLTDGQTPATLLVLRFRSASAHPLSRDNFAIVDISPCGVFAVDPVCWEYESKMHVEIDATFNVVDKASVTGVHPRDLRRKTRRAAMFTMKKNPNPKISTGIPSSVQVAMLLRRNPEDTQFSMAFEIDLRTGLWQHSKRTLRSFFRHAPGSRDNGLQSQMPYHPEH
ncbi:hypothetical protein B0T18DRAFT_388674 [Schizothecium vesticola]|uniref:Uncharacterized protein n=1 Tax=Schizothecium vesticola TaxID=314040 RepID=A0AA40F0Z8_9PEZI|nr:hypothetical protein B0T18DRAFT_388674 [Schizothecium vesticola]